MGHLFPGLTGFVALASVLVAPPGSDAVRQTTEPPETAMSEMGLDGDAQERAREQLTAEELLRALRRKRPANDMILPASAATGGAKSRELALLPEGSPIVDRAGWITHDSGWWNFVFDPADGEPPTKLLPNAGLEVMVRTATGSTSPVKFILSGEMTVFEGENYLVVRYVRRKQTAKRPMPASGGEARKDAADAGKIAPKQAGLPADAPAEDVVSMLQRQEPEAVIAFSALPSSERPGRDGMLSPNVKPDGSPLVHRLGRVVRDGDWWIYVSESDNPDHAEPKMKLLPNRNVELMARSSRRGGIGPIFIVSGEITLFESENFLLPHVAIRKIDNGNLRK